MHAWIVPKELLRSISMFPMLSAMAALVVAAVAAAICLALAAMLLLERTRTEWRQPEQRANTGTSISRSNRRKLHRNAPRKRKDNSINRIVCKLESDRFNRTEHFRIDVKSTIVL